MRRRSVLPRTMGGLSRGGGLAAGLGEDALEQGGGRLGPGGLQHLHPGGSALGVGHHGGAVGATDEVEVEGGLVGGGEGAVERVGEHRLTLGAVLRVAAAVPGFALPNWLKSAHSCTNHLPFYTL